MKAQNTVKLVEVRATMNDHTVMTVTVDSAKENIFTAGYNKICKALNISRLDAEQRYYIAEA